jgi:hypothetical protein
MCIQVYASDPITCSPDVPFMSDKSHMTQSVLKGFGRPTSPLRCDTMDGRKFRPGQTSSRWPTQRAQHGCQKRIELFSQQKIQSRKYNQYLMWRRPLSKTRSNLCRHQRSELCCCVFDKQGESPKKANCKYFDDCTHKGHARHSHCTWPLCLQLS